MTGDFDQKEFEKALSDPDIQERMYKALTDPSGPLFVPTVLAELQRIDDFYVKLIQSPDTPAELIPLTKQGREDLASAMRSFRRVIPPPPSRVQNRRR